MSAVYERGLRARSMRGVNEGCMRAVNEGMQIDSDGLVPNPNPKTLTLKP